MWCSHPRDLRCHPGLSGDLRTTMTATHQERVERDGRLSPGAGNLAGHQGSRLLSPSAVRKKSTKACTFEGTNRR